MRLRNLSRLTLTGIVALVVATSAHAGTFSFTPLGDLPGGLFDSRAQAISADGSTVVGFSHTAAGYEAFRWTKSGGIVGIGDLPGLVFDSRANAVSADGSVIVGLATSALGQEAFRWTESGGMVGLGDLPDWGFMSHAAGVSYDGSVVVGRALSGVGHQAFRWTSETGMVGLGDVIGPGTDSSAFAVSADGSIVVGNGRSTKLNSTAFRWTESTGMVNLGDQPGGGPYGFGAATSVSADGSIIAGNGLSILGREAYRWTSDGGFAWLGDLPGGNFESYALGISADGSIVVGYGYSKLGHEAYRWTSGTGMISLQSLLAGNGVAGLDGWALRSATGISADGTTIVGFGINPAGNPEAWIATIPEPATITLAATGLACACLIAARRRKRQRATRSLQSALLAGFVAFAIATPAHAGAFSFQGLGFLSENPHSAAYGVSADGSVVVGQSRSASGLEAFRWTSGGGMVGLGDLPGGDFYSEAVAVSADGSVVVGQSRSASGLEAFRWTSSGGMSGIGDLPGGSFSSNARAVSADGAVVVGEGSSKQGIQAFRWTSGDGMVELSDLPGGSFSNASAWGASADGSVVVGVGFSQQGIEAFRWTSGGGMVGLGDLPGGEVNSYALGVSADGSVIVGRGNSASGSEAFRWTSGGGIVGLGDLPGGIFHSEAVAVSADGSVVVGPSTSALGIEAFRWTSDGGMVNLRDFLVEHGVSNLTDWTLIWASGVSADGNTIVGFGTNPDGYQEAWIATVPEPATITLAATGLACAIAVGRRKRQRAMSCLKLALLAGLFTFASAVSAHAGAVSFQGIGFLYPEVPESRVEAVSADGRVVVGASRHDSPPFGFQAIRWSTETGIVPLASGDPAGFHSFGIDVSADGSVIAGSITNVGSPNVVYRWTTGDGTILLPTITSVIAISDDGTVLLGTQRGIETTSFLWTTGDGIVPLNFFATALSGDGSVVAGTAQVIGAFRWTAAGGIVDLPLLPGAKSGGNVNAMSFDGSVLVGTSSSAANSAFQAVRWTSAGVQLLGPTLAPSNAIDVSADGRVIVGNSTQPFFWTEELGMVNIKDFLLDSGVSSVTGWSLGDVTGISGDGRTIVGRGTDPDGNQQGWIATIPEPATITLAATGLACACLIAARRRTRQRA